jgi:hypothetical protein
MQVKGNAVQALAIGLVLALIPISGNAAQKVTAGAACKVFNQKVSYLNKTYTCVKSGKKLVWNKDVALPQPTSTPKSYSQYELTKIMAYNNIRAGANIGNLDNVTLIYHVSEYFPKDLLETYTRQVEYASKLYGSFFKKKEVMHIYLYTEKDQQYLSSVPLFTRDWSIYLRWFEAWRNGADRQHNIGGPGGFIEYPSQGVWQGHAGLLVYSGASAGTLRKYSIQVMPHEYWHVIQDYYFQQGLDEKFRSRPNNTMDGQDFYDLLFPPTFREGSANTISFAMSSNKIYDYLDLYDVTVKEAKSQSNVDLYSELTSIPAVESVLKKIENRRTTPDAHDVSYLLGSLLYEWVIAEYGFDAYRKLIENQLIGNAFEDNVNASLGISVKQLYREAAPHILAAFTR